MKELKLWTIVLNWQEIAWHSLKFLEVAEKVLEYAEVFAVLVLCPKYDWI